jgi:uncharacterized glyoxalase superfamily protein PhnB
MPACSVIPELAYADVGAAADWLCDTFGFTVRLRIANQRQYSVVDVGGHVWTFSQSIADVDPDSWNRG